MSRWWKRKKDEPAEPTTVKPEFSDVTIVKKQSADPASDSVPLENTDEHDVLAELSEAFADEQRDPRDDAAKHPWNSPESDPLLGAVSSPSAGERNADDSGADPDDAVTQPTTREAGPTTIAIGGDDELPDAVYLDDELGEETGSDSAPVFIDDDGAGDAIAPKDATGRGIEPRLRQRRIGVRRAAGRRRLIWAAIVGGILVLVIAVLAALGSSLFAVDDVDVSGLNRADPAAVEMVVEELVGEPVLLVDTASAEAQLEAIPYVEAARVRTDFPNSVTIEILEREPVATARGVDGRFRILDRDGRVLDVIDGQPIEFVLIEGSTPLDEEPGQFADVGYSAAAAMVTKLTPEIRARLISMSTVPDGTDLRFTLSNEPGADIEARLGDAVNDSEQIERLVRLQRRLDDVVGSDTTVIDVSTVETIDQ